MTNKEAEDAKFAAWLLTQKGATVTAVRGDAKWNAAVIVNAGDKITGRTR